MRYALALMTLLLPVMAWGADVYAHPTVNDDSDCVCEATGVGAGPCSAQKAVDCAAAGSTVYFETGIEYDLTAAIDFDTNSGLAVNFLLYSTPDCDIEDPSTYAVWDGQSTAGNCWDLAEGINYVLIECQEFKNATSDNLDIYDTIQVVRGVTTHNAGAWGVAGARYSIYFYIDAYSNNAGLAIDHGSGGVNCIARDNLGMGFFVRSLASNVVGSIADTNGDGISLEYGAQAVHNTVYNSTDDGIVSLSASALVVSNIVEGSGTDGIDGYSLTIADYNVLYDNTTDFNGVSHQGSHNVLASATSLVDAANDDFSLVVSAEARSAGMPVLCPDCSRGSRPSIGAWEDSYPSGTKSLFVK